MHKYFDLHACCVPVKGYKRSTICDLQRDTYMLIPNELCKILIEDKTDKTLAQFESEYGNEVLNWFDRLCENGFGSYIDDRDEFLNLQKIKLDYHEPRLITNAIVDFDEFSNHDMSNIYSQLSGYLCEAIELRFFFGCSLDRLHEILNGTYNSTFRSVEIVVGFQPELTQDNVVDLIDAFPRITKITIHSSSENFYKEIQLGKKMLIYTDVKIDSEFHCGVVSPSMFASNLILFTESQKHNSCLNRKISIDKRGNIRNCPSMLKSYGSIHNTTISEIVELPEFQEVWGVAKDQIEDCSVCEFRYMCQDCRAYVKDADNKYSKPLKCNYNPYEAKWN